MPDQDARGPALGPDLQKYVERTFWTRLEDDQLLPGSVGHFGQDMDPPGMRSMREFIGTVADLAVSKNPSLPKPPAITDFDQTLGVFLGRPMRLPDGETAPTAVLLAGLVLTPMVLDILQDFSIPAFDATPQQRELLERSSRIRRAWEPDPLRFAEGRRLVNRLIGILLVEMGNRTLRSFFMKQPQPGQLLRWWPGASTDIGEPLKAHSVPTTWGPVQVTVRRYDTEGLPINAYEWSATLMQPPSKTPLAVACGMGYVFKRSRAGRAAAGAACLVDASDMASDTDVSQVRAFLEQHRDAAQVMQASDLCFVWIWERQPHLPKGVGQAVLAAALQDLKKRFPRMYTAILSVEPYQFRESAGNLPSVIMNAQLEAHDRLYEYCVGLEQALAMKLLLTTARQMRPGETLNYVGQVAREDLNRRGEAAEPLPTLEDLAAMFRGKGAAQDP